RRSRTVRTSGLWPICRQYQRGVTGGPREGLPSEEFREPAASRPGCVEPRVLVLGHVRLEPLPVVGQPAREEDLAGEELVGGLRRRGFGFSEFGAPIRCELARERVAGRRH